MTVARWVLLGALTGVATLVLARTGVPSPALFAGLAAGTALALAGWAPTAVPGPASVLAQGVIGVVVGVLAQPAALAAVAADWGPVLLVSVGTLLVSMGAGGLLGLVRGVGPLTGVLALTAGGASGLVAISRELGGDERVVAVVQYLRVGLVTATMPVVAVAMFAGADGFAGQPPPDAPVPGWGGVALTVGCCAVGIPAARLIRLPAGALLGPMTVALLLATTGVVGPAGPPHILVGLAYAVIGWQAGVGFTRPALRTVARALPAALLLIVAVVGACAALGAAFSALTGASALTGYLATTPGGIYAVLATAAAADVDVTSVLAVQVSRVLLMLLLAPVVARLVTRRSGSPP